MIKPSTFASVAEKAEQDIQGFFLECTNPQVLESLKSDPSLQNLRGWDQRCKKVYDEISTKIKKEQDRRKKYNNILPDYTDAIQSIEDLLLWLEGRKTEEEWPWKSKPTRREIEDKNISYLINLFKKTFLDGLCMPSQGSLILPNNWLLKKFLDYVGWSKNLDGNRWRVIPVRVGPGDGPVVPAHFLSWLVVDDEHKTLYIPFNKVAISSGAKDKREIITRLETVFLHELGHAVDHLDWFKEKLNNFDPEKDFWCMMGLAKKQDNKKTRRTKWVGAPAVHEFGAWTYALSVRGWVRSTRSWIRRLVRELDDEFINP